MNKQVSVSAARDARRLYRSKNAGILSTISLELAGYPFGSLTPYAPDAEGRPILLVSEIAEHSHNMAADPKVSLTINQSDSDEAQAQGRITIVGDALRIEGREAEAADRYFHYFPYARSYLKAHGFHFVRIDPVRIRYIGGFGKIFWIEASDFLQANPFRADARNGILEHMNADHVDALRHYVQSFTRDSVTPDDAIAMVDIDGEGIDLLLREKTNIRVEFPRPIENSAEARQMLTEMARA